MFRRLAGLTLFLALAAGCTPTTTTPPLPDPAVEFPRVLDVLREEAAAEISDVAPGISAWLVPEGIRCVEDGCDIIAQFVRIEDDKLIIELDMDKFCWTPSDEQSETDLPEQAIAECEGRALAWSGEYEPGGLYATILVDTTDALGIPRNESTGVILDADASDASMYPPKVGWDTTAGWHIQAERSDDAWLHFEITQSASYPEAATTVHATQQRLQAAMKTAAAALEAKRAGENGDLYGATISYTCPADRPECTLADWFFPYWDPEASATTSASVFYGSEGGCGLEDCVLEGMTTPLSQRIVGFLADEIDRAIGCNVEIAKDAPMAEGASKPAVLCPVTGGGSVEVSWEYLDDGTLFVWYEYGTLGLYPTPTPVP
jgi:hypothetical protein